MKPCKYCKKPFVKKNPLNPFCQPSCYSAYTRERKKPKVDSRKPQISESEVFRQIWEGLAPKDRKSFVTGKILSDTENARAWYFSHVLPKGKAKYPMFKYYQKNIVLKEFKEHELWELHQKDLIDNPQWSHVFDLKKELLEEYEEHLKLYQQGIVEYYKI